MEQFVSPGFLLLRFRWPGTIAATLGLYLICALVFAGAAHALDPNKRLTQYMHTSWRIQDGSAPAGMFSVTQTSDGYLWFTSVSHGMYRFDGVRLLPQTFAVDGKTIDHLIGFHADRIGGLWGIGEHEIFHLKDGVVFSHFPLEAQQRTANIAEDADGSLWILNAGYDIAKPLCHVTDRAVKCFGEADGLRIATGGEALLADGNGGFWLGGQKAVVHWRPGVSEPYPITALKSNSADGVAALALDANASLWVGLIPAGPGEGLGRLEDGVFKPFVTQRFDGSKLVVFAMTVDREGSLWVGTVDNGLYRIRGTAVEHFGRAEGLSSDSVQALFEDKEGILWVATASGIDRFRDPPVTTFSVLEGLTEDQALGVLAGRDGTVWVANAGSLDRIEKSGTVSSIRWKKGLPGPQVTAMLEDRAGNLWIAVADGLYLFKNGLFRRLPEPDHEPLGLVLAMTEDADGSIWAECSGKSRRLVRIRDFEIREQFLAPKAPMGRIAADPQGGIWIGTRRAELVLFRDGVQKKVALGSGASGRVNHLVARKDGSVLAALDDGLFGMRDGKVQRMTTKNGLPCNAIYSFIEDKEKQWWLLAECGVIALADSELQRWWANPEARVQTRLYDGFDGARPAQFGINSAALSADGRVWFATGFVVQMLDPSQLSREGPAPVTYVESVTADHKEFAATDGLKIPPRPRDLQIQYTSPTFSAPQKLKFRYRLDPYDRDWRDADTRRQAFYTDLPPGEFSFRIIALNGDGAWSERATKLDFSITPAYYQTNWFRALSFVVFLGLVWGAYRWRIRQLQHQFAITLDARVGERTRIARDLHDTLLQSFQGVLPRFQAAIYKLPEHPADARATLEAAVDQASLAITEGRDAVQGLRASTVEKNDLAVAIRTVGEELASADTQPSSPAFQVAVEGTPRNLHPILRDEVYRIAAEALRNAFRHAQAQQIEVELRYDEKDFRLRIRDDGRGIHREVLSGDGREGHYGLHGMRERAELVGGEFAIWSEVDSGTEVELSIPASRAYAKSVRRFWFFEKLSKKDTDAKEKIES
jgi:signal transduction histidine kinase/ligand-binding sensor domain-containing protein